MFWSYSLDPINHASQNVSLATVQSHIYDADVRMSNGGFHEIFRALRDGDVGEVTVAQTSKPDCEKWLSCHAASRRPSSAARFGMKFIIFLLYRFLCPCAVRCDPSSNLLSPADDPFLPFFSHLLKQNKNNQQEIKNPFNEFVFFFLPFLLNQKEPKTRPCCDSKLILNIGDRAR